MKMNELIDSQVVLEESLVDPAVREEWDRTALARYVNPLDERWEENAAFIATARSDVPRLIAEVRRLRSCKEVGSDSS